jgi:hypothetical protein
MDFLSSILKIVKKSFYRWTSFLLFKKLSVREGIVMANPEHVKQLTQGVTNWNAWREKNPDVHPNLNGADLSDTNLTGANLRGADLRNADLHDATMSGSRLSGAYLSNANLSGANLSDTDLSGANLSNVNLNNTNLSGAKMWASTIARVDFSTTKGFTEVQHGGPSVVQLHTTQLPQDGSALHFLRGAGIPDEYIDLWRSAVMHPIQYHSLFISYSSKDETLARRLYADLQAQGVRCWFAPEDLKIGTKFRQHIDEAIHQQDKLLLLLSKQSIASTWVENEVEAALEKEDQQQREVLFPIRLDDVVMQTPKAWAATLRRARNIGDFSAWTDPQAYQSALDRLLRDLKQN